MLSLTICRLRIRRDGQVIGQRHSPHDREVHDPRVHGDAVERCAAEDVVTVSRADVDDLHVDAPERRLGLLHFGRNRRLNAGVLGTLSFRIVPCVRSGSFVGTRAS